VEEVGQTQQLNQITNKSSTKKKFADEGSIDKIEEDRENGKDSVGKSEKVLEHNGFDVFVANGESDSSIDYEIQAVIVIPKSEHEDGCNKKIRVLIQKIRIRTCHQNSSSLDWCWWRFDDFCFGTGPIYCTSEKLGSDEECGIELEKELIVDFVELTMNLTDLFRSSIVKSREVLGWMEPRVPIWLWSKWQKVKKHATETQKKSKQNQKFCHQNQEKWYQNQ